MDRSKETPLILSPHPLPLPRWGEGKGGENERRKKWIKTKNMY
jgi:hypothetical protein